LLDPDSYPSSLEETRAYRADYNQVVAKTSPAPQSTFTRRGWALHPKPRVSRLVWQPEGSSKGKCRSNRLGAREVEAGSQWAAGVGPKGSHMAKKRWSKSDFDLTERKRGKKHGKSLVTGAAARVGA